jgi:heptosyltransferase I
MSGWEGPPPREICIVMLSAIGDAVHVLPVANALKRAWPESRITWIVQTVPHGLVAGHPAIDEFVVFRRLRGVRAWRSFDDVRRALRGRSFDLLLGLQVYLKAGVITVLTDARVKLGFDRVRARDAQWLFTTHRIPPHAPQHVQDQYFEFLAWLGVEAGPVEWRLEPTAVERDAQQEFFARLDRPACAVVLATSNPLKDWSTAGYARVLDEVERSHGLRPVLVGGPSTTERAAAAEVTRNTGARIVDALGDDVRKLLWLLEGSALVISPDTGPLHIARAVGTPVVGLYGHTDPKRTGPYRMYEDLVVDGYSREGRRGGMQGVTVERVLEKVDLAVRKHVRRV